MDDTMGTPRLDALVRRATRRRRATHVVGALPLSLLVSSATVLSTVLVLRAAAPHARTSVHLVTAAVLPLVLVLLAAWLRRVSALDLLVRLDRTHELGGRLATAYELAREPGGSDFVAAAIADAETHVEGLDPAKTFPFVRPPGLGLALATFAGALTLGVVLRPLPRAVRLPTPTRVLVPVRLDRETTAALRDDLARRLRGPVDDETRRLVGAYNQLLTDLAEGRLEREEALRRIAQLSRSLELGSGAGSGALAQDLAAVGRRLGRSSTLATELSETLASGDAARAAEAANRLSTRLREDAPDRAALEALRRDLARAARDESAEARNAELDRQRREVESLLARQRQQGLDREQQSLLERRRRELERLERDQRGQEERRRQLERLRRDLDEASNALGGAGGSNDASDAMNRASEDLNQMAEQQMSESQRQELERQLSQLREMIRRQRESGSGGSEGSDRRSGGDEGGDPMQRFVLRAGGEDGDGQRVAIRGPSSGGSAGQSDGTAGGEAASGEGAEPGGEGRQGATSSGEAGNTRGGSAQGASGSPSGPSEAEMVLELGGRGGQRATIEMPGLGGAGSGSAGGASRPAPGRGSYGDSHSPSGLENPTEAGSAGRVSQLVGEERGGGSRSEVILGAASRGFVSTGYRPVYSDYAGHAEEILRRDRIPPGYRYYVRRYFQLIRPREAGNE